MPRKDKDYTEEEEEEEEKVIVYRGFIGWRQAVAEAKTLKFWRDCVCETVVTFFLIFACLTASISFPNNPASILHVALTAGIYVFIMIETFGHVQLAVMNPLAALCFVCMKRLSFLKALVYLVFQLGATTLATKCVYEISPPESRVHIKPLHLGPGVTIGAALAVEAFITAALCFIILGALDVDRRKVYMPALPVGLTVTAGVFIGEKFTCGCMNPLLPFGPAAVTGNWENHWIYWVGDFMGGIIACLLYNLFNYEGWPFGPKKNKKPHHKDQEAKIKMLRDPQNGKQSEEDAIILRTGYNDSSNI